jgi:hypothetical protein
MSQVSPGWYPDPSGRFVQRYHDGTRWTEHVADAGGTRSIDTPEAPGGGAGQYGAQGYQQSPGGGGYGQQPGGPDYGAPPGGYQGGPGSGGYQGGPGSGSGSGGYQGGPGSGGYQGGPGSGSGGPSGETSARGQGQQPGYSQTGPGPGYYGQPGYSQQPGGQGYGPPGGGQGYTPPPGYGQQPGGPGYGQPGYGYTAARPAGGPFTLTFGVVLAGIGALFVLLSAFALDFIKIANFELSLGDVNDAGPGVPSAIDRYAGIGRYLAVLAVVFAFVVALRLPALAKVAVLPIVAAVVCGLLAVWSLVAMFTQVEGADSSPAVGAFVGLLGYAGAIAGQFVTRPLTSRT